MFRYRGENTKSSYLGSAATTSSSSRYHEPGYVLRECPDCGHPHPEPLRRHRDKRSLRVATQSDTHTSSGGLEDSVGAPVLCNLRGFVLSSMQRTFLKKI